MAGSASFRILLNKVRLYLAEQISSFGDFILFAMKVPAIKNSQKITAEGKAIIFIGETLPPRIPRLAKWAKKLAGFSPVLLCHRSGYYSKFTNKDFDHTLLYRNSWHLKRLLRVLPKPYVIHGFAPKSKFPGIAMEYMKVIY